MCCKKMWGECSNFPVGTLDIHFLSLGGWLLLCMHGETWTASCYLFFSHKRWRHLTVHQNSAALCMVRHLRLVLHECNVTFADSVELPCDSWMTVTADLMAPRNLGRVFSSLSLPFLFSGRWDATHANQPRPRKECVGFSEEIQRFQNTTTTTMKISLRRQNQWSRKEAQFIELDPYR